MWGEVTLLSPGWLLLLPLTVLVALRWGTRIQGLFTPTPSIEVRHPLADCLHTLSARSTGSPLYVRIVVIAALSLMLLAMAQPVRLGAPLNDETLPVELVIMVDTSVTMSIRDYLVEGEAVDRLTVAKVILDRFLSEFKGRRVALVVLGQPSAIWLPLTKEIDLARHLLGRLKPSLAGRHAGVGDALVEVAEQFSDESGRIAMLVSDGVLPAGTISPVEGGKRLAQRGMKLMALGIGARAEEVADQLPMGLIYEPLDLELLQDIVEPSGGVVHHALTVEEAVASLHAEIGTMPMKAVDATNDNRRQIPLYPWLLTPALILLLGLPLSASGSRRAEGHP